MRCAKLEQLSASGEVIAVAVSIDQPSPPLEPAFQNDTDPVVEPEVPNALNDMTTDTVAAVSVDGTDDEPDKSRKRKRKTKETVTVTDVTEPLPPSQEPPAEAKNLALMVIPQPQIELEVDAAKPDTRKRKRKKKTGQLENPDECNEHSWGDWYYAEDNPCHLVRECTICHKLDKETMAVQHELAWLQAQLPQPECLWVQQCQRCGHIETQENRHYFVWTALASEPCIHEYRCEHCGHVAETQANHKWFLTHRSERGTEHYTCEICHRTMVR
jgi:hypothetical protein